MPNNSLDKAKSALDAIIRKDRVHLYKPIQIAEILYRHRIGHIIDLLDKETYRIQSRKWRDEISIDLIGSRCTSTIKFQDNLFDENAIPPHILKILGDENKHTKGAIEAYIYSKFMERLHQLKHALGYLQKHDRQNFDIKCFIDLFWNEPGLKRSIDKVYEAVTYALFSTLVDVLKLKIEISISRSKIGILREFEDFARIVMGININQIKTSTMAAIYRVGVTNAADRGLDMYANWGPAIQIKHLSLDPELAKEIVTGISSNRIVIVCKDAEESVIESIMRQAGFANRIQGVITESDLIKWYNKCLRGAHRRKLGEPLLQCLSEQLQEEFPSLDRIPEGLRNRHYENITRKGIWA